jgi:hypothetical protein
MLYIWIVNQRTLFHIKVLWSNLCNSVGVLKWPTCHLFAKLPCFALVCCLWVLFFTFYEVWGLWRCGRCRMRMWKHGMKVLNFIGLDWISWFGLVWFVFFFFLRKGFGFGLKFGFGKKKKIDSKFNSGCHNESCIHCIEFIVYFRCANTKDIFHYLSNFSFICTSKF